MAQPCKAPSCNQVAIVGPQYCKPSSVDLTIKRKTLFAADGKFEVSDVQGNTVFKVKSALLSLRDKLELLDMQGNPVISLRQKIMTAHRRWQVYKGSSTHDKDLLFSVKQSTAIQIKSNLDVFLASNTKEKTCDFKIMGSWFEKSCAVYLGDSTNMIAQVKMWKMQNVQSVMLGRDTCMVTVNPNVDYAFIVALILIWEEINEDRKDAVRGPGLCKLSFQSNC